MITGETLTARDGEREIPCMARCRRCKSALRVSAFGRRVLQRVDDFGNPRYALIARYPMNLQCCVSRVINGSTVEVREIKGRVTEQPCGAKCMGSKGHDCECSCGGANHGKSYAA